MNWTARGHRIEPIGRIGKLLITATLATACINAAMGIGALGQTETEGLSGPPLPPFALVQQTVAMHFATLEDYHEGDLIARGDVQSILRKLQRIGWKVANGQAILERALNDNNFLVRQMRTPAGKRFMRKVSAEKNIYDRLDRVSRHSGGQDLVSQLTRLPDGDKYAKANPGRGNPDLSDLLLISERGSAHNRRLKDYEKPTGLIYTAKDLLYHLRQSYPQSPAERDASDNPRLTLPQ